MYGFSKPLVDLYQVYDCVEVFSGAGALSRCLNLAGYRTASLDIGLWQPWLDDREKLGKRKHCKTNALDLLTPSGFA